LLAEVRRDTVPPQALRRGDVTMRCVGFGRAGLAVFVLLLLIAAHAATPTRAQSGIGVTYHAGWNLIGGPDGTTLPGTIALLTMGPGDPDYVRLPAQGPIAGGRGYWAFFAADTTITLAGAGQMVAQVPAPPGQYIMIGNPSGVQSAVVSGADDVEVWDNATGTYQRTTVLGVGQGGWAMSRTGGIVTITGTGPALSVPPAAAPSVAAPAVTAPQPAATPTPKLAVSISIDQQNSTANSRTPGKLIFTVNVTLDGQPAPGARLTGTLTFVGLPQGPLAPVTFGPDDLGSYTGETITLNLPALATGARVLIHVTVTLGSQNASADATYTVPS